MHDSDTTQVKAICIAILAVAALWYFTVLYTRQMVIDRKIDYLTERQASRDSLIDRRQMHRDSMMFNSMDRWLRGFYPKQTVRIDTVYLIKEK